MNIKLNVIKLNNNDVITTSVSNNCEDVYGCIGVGDDHTFIGITSTETEIYDIVTAKLNELDKGYYHFDENGNIIGKCPSADSEATHGIGF